MNDVKTLGQVFTPREVVRAMLCLRRNAGSVLEPSCGDGAFVQQLAEGFVGVEIDPQFSHPNVLAMDFFDYDVSNKFDTIIGNPPYVRFQDIPARTKTLLNMDLFDSRTNLYLFFIAKCIAHLQDAGELIFITPRDFLKATSSVKLNEFIYANGTITDMADLGDQKIFGEFTPNCAIWRFEKNNFTRKTRCYHNFLAASGRRLFASDDSRRSAHSHNNFLLADGQLLFAKNDYPVSFSDLFFVKVGAVSGADTIFTNEQHGNCDFVCSWTHKSGATKKMIYNQKHPSLQPHKEVLLRRKIRAFDEGNWWEWGRKHYHSAEKRVYVNAKTRARSPFFLHDSPYYDGAVLAVFPKNQQLDLRSVTDELNQVNWHELGFVCDGRFLFNQRSLENARLPDSFLRYAQ